jgi:hypothetical protein
VDSPQRSSQEKILSDAQQRARTLFEAVNRDADSLRVSRDPAHAEGVALCEDVAGATRQLIAELERQKAPAHDGV